MFIHRMKENDFSVTYIKLFMKFPVKIHLYHAVQFSKVFVLILL